MAPVAASCRSLATRDAHGCQTMATGAQKQGACGGAVPTAKPPQLLAQNSLNVPYAHHHRAEACSWQWIAGFCRVGVAWTFHHLLSYRGCRCESRQAGMLLCACAAYAAIWSCLRAIEFALSAGVHTSSCRQWTGATVGLVLPWHLSILDAACLTLVVRLRAYSNTAHVNIPH